MHAREKILAYNTHTYVHVYSWCANVSIYLSLVLINVFVCTAKYTAYVRAYALLQTIDRVYQAIE